MHKLALVFFLLVVTVVTGCCDVAHAQWNSEVYEPRIGFPNEIDTIYGSKDQQNLGGGLVNIGPKPGSPYGRIWLTGVKEGPALIGLSPFFEVNAGPDFEIKKLRSRARELPINFQRNWQRVPIASSKSNDLLVDINDGFPTIYWEDSLGNYDTSRTTRLLPRGTGEPGVYDDPGYLLYNTFLSSDTVHDIITFVVRGRDDGLPDSIFALLYKGGPSMKGRFIYPTEMVFAGYRSASGAGKRYSTKGDWRGTGRDDLISADPASNAYFYYAAERPFSLANFAHSMFYDTLMTTKDEPRISSFVTGGIAMKAYPKRNGDLSKDLVFTLIFKDTGQVVHFFRGHTEFGKHRLTSDSAQVKIYPFNDDLKGFGFDANLQDVGDMTGTGNSVLYFSASQDGGYTTYHLFYVTGTALDDSADMVYMVYPRGRAYVDTITANGDNLQDVILGIPDFYTFKDLDRGKTGVGTVQVIYGSNKIHVKGQSSVKVSEANCCSIQAFPNPAMGSTTAVLNSVRSPNLILRLSDCLGREIKSDSFAALVGSRMSFLMDLSDVPAGSYIVSIQNGERLLKTKLLVL